MKLSQAKKWHILLCTLAWTFLILLSSHSDDGIPVLTIIEKLPREIHVDLQQNLLLYASGNKVYAYDLASAQQLWWKPCNYKGIYHRAVFGQDYIVLYTEELFVVLDKFTGNEVWREAMSSWQQIEYAWFESQSNWLRLRCDGGFFLYDLDTRKGYRIPFEEYSRIGMMHDGNTLYTFKSKEEDPPPSRMEALFWRPGDRQPAKRFTLESPGELMVRGVAGNEFLVSDYLYKRSPEHILRTYDATTGEILRELTPDLAATMPKYYFWASRSDGYHFWLDEDQKYLYRMEAASGASSVVAIPENFKAINSSTTKDDSGNWWFLAWDEDRNLWLLPFNHDASPRKLLDGKRFLPSSSCRLFPPYLFSYDYSKDESTGIYHLQNMQKVFEGAGYMYEPTQSEEAEYVALWQREAEGLVRTNSTWMYRQGKEEPLFTVKGLPRAISPDGHYLVIFEHEEYYSYKTGTTRKDYEAYKKDNPDKRAIHIIDVETAESVARFDVAGWWPAAAFSEDNQYLALQYDSALKVLDVEQDFREIPLFVPGRKDISIHGLGFSPDGQQLLASGYGEAFLFDVAAGKHLLTITEKRRFKNRYAAASGANIFRKILSKAEEFVGRYTDRFKNKPDLRAQFNPDGSQIITVAQNMLIRVWNAKTGTLIHTLDPKMPETRNQWGRIDNSIVISKNGAYALTYNQNGFDTGTLWDIEKSLKIRCYTFQGAQSVEAALSDDGSRMYALINGDLYFLNGAVDKK